MWRSQKSWTLNDSEEAKAEDTEDSDSDCKKEDIIKTIVEKKPTRDRFCSIFIPFVLRRKLNHDLAHSAKNYSFPVLVAELQSKGALLLDRTKEYPR